jgi:hypothetical protein
MDDDGSNGYPLPMWMKISTIPVNNVDTCGNPNREKGCEIVENGIRFSQFL